MAALTMFYPHLFGYPRTANGRPYNVLSIFIWLSEDGQWLSLQCSVHIYLVIRGRPMAVPTLFFSASERKQIMINVQSKRVYERIVVAPPLAQRLRTA